MSGRRRNWVIWLVVIALLLIVGLAVVFMLLSGQNAGATNNEITASAIVAQNATIKAQLEATQLVVDHQATQQALALTAQQEAVNSAATAQLQNATANANAGLAATLAAIAVQTAESRATQTAFAQVPTEPLTPTNRPSPSPTAIPTLNDATITPQAIVPEDSSLTATALASMLQPPVSDPTATEQATNPVSLTIVGKPTLSNVQMTATALAILFESTAITPTSRPIGGGETATPTADTGGDSVTETPTPSATPLVIAAANLLIRSDVSGEVIGDGTLRVYAPESAKYPETARVELELHLDNLYITPTPTGERGTPVPRSTTVSSPNRATATPYLPIITDQGIPVYQRMGATLLCSEQSFRGCDSGRDQSQAKIVSSETTTWSWIISPEQDAAGLQDLQLDVWLIERNLDGNLEYLDLPGTPYRFRIEANPATGSNIPFLIGGVIVVIALIGGAFVVSQRRITPSPAQRPALKNAPLVFISYRRGPSWGQARSIEQSLRERGANVFIDIDDINEGHFAETIEKAIQDCDYFVAVLAPGTLDSLWVRREIASALAAKKTIVPLLMDGFRLDAENIPPEIRDIASHNAITVLPEFYQEAMNRLAKRFLRLGDKGDNV